MSFPVLVFLYACAPTGQYYAKVEKQLVQREYQAADKIIEKNEAKYGHRNAILYHLDRAMTLHLGGDYSRSNTFLEKAEIEMEDLYTKSITAETGAMLTNDNLLPYEGEDFEKVMVNIIGALNYVFLSEWDEALVEARKVDHKLNLLNDRYEKKNIYKEDAFARYLSGILYESKGELNDAFIAYRKAYETYQDYLKDYNTRLPPTIRGDLLRITDALGFKEEHEFYKEKFSDLHWISQKELEDLGELIFISHDGWSPVKRDVFIDAPIPDGNQGIYLLRVALPQFVERSANLSWAEVHIIGQEGAVASQRTFVVEDITAIAIKNLEDRIGRITVKAIARATTKYLASRTAEHEAAKSGGDLAGEVVGLLTNVYSIATEKADKRSWRTLPGRIRMARLTAPPGTYTVSVEYYTLDQRMIVRKTYEITLKAGEMTFLSERVFGETRPLKIKRMRRRR